MTPPERKHLFNVVLIEIVAAFAVCMVTLIALNVTGRFDEPYRGDMLCNTADECTRLVQ